MFSSGLPRYESVQSAIKEAVSPSAQGYHTNNKYPEFPPLMNDGRSITASWQPNADANHNLMQQNNIRSNWQYRQYLQKNALEIMQHNFNASSPTAKHQVAVPNIQSNMVNSSMSGPARFSSVLDATPVLGGSMSDLKEAYLTREQLDARKVSPVITQAELLRDNALKLINMNKK